MWRLGIDCLQQSLMFGVKAAVLIDDDWRRRQWLAATRPWTRGGVVFLMVSRAVTNGWPGCILGNLHWVFYSLIIRRGGN